MEQFVSLSWFTWFAVTAGVLAPIAHALYPRIRRRFHQLQLDYRRTHGTLSLGEEIEFLEDHLSDDLPDIRFAKLLQESLLGGAAASTGLWLSEAEPETKWIVLFFGSTLIITAAFNWWHIVNDPPTDMADDGITIIGEAYEIPTEAWAGLVGGVLFVAVAGGLALAAIP